MTDENVIVSAVQSILLDNQAGGISLAGAFYVWIINNNPSDYVCRALHQSLSESK